MDSESDDDTFVTIGTALEPYDEDEVAKKPIAIQNQTVTDSHGRPRFHGAFTGGFSAGYFNTVGSKEGFAPSTFVSSRDKRNDASNRRPEDFMDDEDFSEHGIAPKEVSTTETFKSGEKRKKNAMADDSANISLLKDLVVPHSNSMGFKLLRNLGWKEGQGIGPRIQRRKQKSKGGSQKTYGCSLPPTMQDSESEDDDEFIPQNVTFAPKDVNPITFKPKDDIHGLGYSGLNRSSVLGTSTSSEHVNLFESSERNVTAGFRSKQPARGGKIGLRGQAFGVGGYEDEDDVDVYGRESMDNYDIELGGAAAEDRNHGWTAPKHKGLSSAPVGYIGKVLEGFKLSSRTLKAKKIYPAPELPRGFKPFHSRSVPSKESVVVDTRNMDANARKNMLGEIKSVFDLVSTSDKAKIDAAKKIVKKEPVESGKKPGRAPPKSRFEDENAKNSSSASIKEESNKTTSLYKGSGVFKPFAIDPAKQQRYEMYLETTKKGQKYGLDDVVAGSMTEWERTKEANEFGRAAQLYRPMSSLMASRFTNARFDDNDQTVELPAEELTDRSDQKKAVDMKMFGKLTRERYDWHPDRTLCKRFNVANPYPESTVVGVPKVKRDKYSIFNFLNDPTSGEQSRAKSEDEDSDMEEQEQPSAHEHLVTDATVKRVKPLSILASGENEPPMTSDQQSTSHEADKTDTGKERPSMDIFKAIFSSSDDSSSSEDESQPVPNMSQSEKSISVLSSIFGDENHGIATPELNPGTIPIESLKERLTPQVEQPGINVGVQLHTIECIKQEDKSFESSSDTKQNDKFEVPMSLPQPPGESSSERFGSTSAVHQYMEPEESMWVEKTIDSDSSDDNKKHKHKHKKKKKSSHKKHKTEKKSKKKKKKKEKKKKKKKEVIVVSSSSSSSGSEADAESDDSDTDKKILQKIRSLPERSLPESRRRPTADDFM